MMLKTEGSAPSFLSSYVWQNGTAVFTWSDGSTEKILCSIARAMEKAENGWKHGP